MSNVERVTRIFNSITVSVFGLILLGISGTYLSDYLSSIDWFGDTHSRWGARHYWYNIGTGVLFVITSLRCIVTIDAMFSNNDKKEKES